jgi:hypothetical protein
VLDASIATVDIARSDPELQHLLATSGSVSLHRLLTSHTSMRGNARCSRTSFSHRW